MIVIGMIEKNNIISSPISIPDLRVGKANNSNSNINNNSSSNNNNNSNNSRFPRRYKKRVDRRSNYFGNISALDYEYNTLTKRQKLQYCRRNNLIFEEFKSFTLTKLNNSNITNTNNINNTNIINTNSTNTNIINSTNNITTNTVIETNKEKPTKEIKINYKRIKRIEENYNKSNFNYMNYIYSDLSKHTKPFCLIRKFYINEITRSYFENGNKKDNFDVFKLQRKCNCLS